MGCASDQDCPIVVSCGLWPILNILRTDFFFLKFISIESQLHKELMYAKEH